MMPSLEGGGLLQTNATESNDNILSEVRSHKIYPIIKSAQSGVTLCFQFVSAASAAATTFGFHVKTVWA